MTPYPSPCSNPTRPNNTPEPPTQKGKTKKGTHPEKRRRNNHNPLTSHPTTQFTTYRIQSTNQDVCDLLNPEQQHPFPMNQGENPTRHGISGCATLSDLATNYRHPQHQGRTPALVQITGPLSKDTPRGQRRRRSPHPHPQQPRPQEDDTKFLRPK